MLFGVGEDLESFLDALEERIVIGVAGEAGLFIGVVLEDLFTVGDADLVLSSFVSQFGEAEDGVVVLFLEERIRIVTDF